MSFIPRFKLYASNGSTLLYTFIAVQSTNAPQTPTKNTVISGMRGQGCIVIPGAAAEWDLTFNGILLAENYEALVVLMDALESALLLNTKYVLKVEKTSVTSYSYNVMRIVPIEYPESLRNNFQEYQVTLKANSW